MAACAAGALHSVVGWPGGNGGLVCGSSPSAPQNPCYVGLMEALAEHSSAACKKSASAWWDPDIFFSLCSVTTANILHSPSSSPVESGLEPGCAE